MTHPWSDIGSYQKSILKPNVLERRAAVMAAVVIMKLRKLEKKLRLSP